MDFIVSNFTLNRPGLTLKSFTIREHYTVRDRLKVHHYGFDNQSCSIFFVLVLGNDSSKGPNHSVKILFFPVIHGEAVTD
jgi:hypothetical protein